MGSEWKTNRWALAGALVAGTALVGALLWMEGRSLERANRLYRDGDVLGAVRLYRAHAEAAGPTPRASYNLGTALLSVDHEEAERHLRMALLDAGPPLLQRVHYNLGYRSLTAIEPSAPPDSALPLAVAAVAADREALRLDPADENARWNLALAQRTLDSLVELTGELAQESLDETEEQIESTTAESDPHDMPPAEEEGERAGAVLGARETLAGPGDPGPLTEGEALALIEQGDDTPEKLVQGAFWAYRPIRQGWWSAPPPGGAW